MTPTYVDYGDRIAFANDDGSHVVWKAITYDGSGNVVGPGYIGRIIWRAADGTISGKRPCDGFIAPTLTVNDPSIQGVGISGWHHYRNIPNEPNIWNKGWDFGGHRDAAARGGFGVVGSSVVVAPYSDTNGYIRASFSVDFADPWSTAEGKRVANIRYDYIVEPSDVKCWTTFTEWPDGFDSYYQPFVKEPKYAVGIGGSSYTPNTLIIFDPSNTTLQSYDLINDPKLQNPTTGTEQIPNGPRTRAAFYDGTDYFNIVAKGNTALTYDGTTHKVTNYGTRDYWAGTGKGLDAFAVDADSRTHFDDTVCAAYCLTNGSLSRKWEVAKRGGDSRVEIMFHGWEGGSGLPDCLCAARNFETGNVWVNYWSTSRNSGWVL